MWWGGIREGACHVECRAGREGGFLPVDVLCAEAREAHGEDGPEAEDFFDEGGDVGDFFFRQAVFPCVAVGVYSHDVFVGALLDYLAVWRGEVANAHNDVAGHGVKACGDHGETHGFDLGCEDGQLRGREQWCLSSTFVELGFWVLQHVSGNAGFVLSLGNLILEHVQQERQVLVASFSIFLCLIISTWPYPHQRDVILPVVARASQIRHHPLNMHDLLEEGTVDRPIDANPVVQRQARVQGKSLEVGVWINILLSVVAIRQ